MAPGGATDQLAERAAVLALVDVTKAGWHRTASVIEEAGSALRLLRHDYSGLEVDEQPLARELVGRVKPDAVQRFMDVIERLEAEEIQVLTVLDEGYPTNLRDVFNRPPMLFVKGRLLDSDERAVAVVGTRTASPKGLAEARRLASELARRGVTVLSGLAKGIDTAAHEGALESGGRTIAVMGTGIRRVYPAENAALSKRILEHGALVSQFWPDAPPTQSSFPIRNVTMSGMGIGTAVIEASATSGAKMQARLALEHGKRLFLVESLVMSQAWAKRYATRPGAIVVRSADEILPLVDRLTKPARELTLF